MSPALLILTTIIAATLAGAPVARAAAVDVGLVLAVDVSESIDDDEYQLQHEGIARAFEDRAISDAIRAGSHGAIDVLVLEWSDRDKQIVTVDWTRIDGPESAAAFAARVRASRRSSGGLTAIGDALLAGAAAFKNLPDQPVRKVIDVSGDGMANIGPPPQQVRDALVAQGFTINGLAILTSEPWLDQYYDYNVVGGIDGFLLKIETLASFADGIRQKLVTEISAVRPGGRTAVAQMQ